MSRECEPTPLLGTAPHPKGVECPHDTHCREVVDFTLLLHVDPNFLDAQSRRMVFGQQPIHTQVPDIMLAYQTSPWSAASLELVSSWSLSIAVSIWECSLPSSEENVILLRQTFLLLRRANWATFD